MIDARRTLWLLVAGVALGVVAVFAFRGSPSAQRDGREAGHMRIVSLAPSMTEMLFALGLGDSVVAATDYCDYPPEAKKIERVGGFGAPNMERLLALSPDLVVAADFERDEVAHVLRGYGIRVIEIPMRSMDEMFLGLRQIGQAAGNSERAEEVVAQMQAELKAVASQFTGTPGDSLPRVFVELWDDPLTTVGRGSFVDDVVARAGGVNVARELPQPHPCINPEKVIEWNPDVIVVAHMSRGAGAAAQMADRIGWSEIAAVRKGRIVRDIPADLILRPGPRLVEGVKLLAERLHGAATGAGSAANKSGAARP